tara:strand:- start:838 stop:1287 length:450 start_codon:yes stop_codon:yes gene_type:complete
MKKEQLSRLINSHKRVDTIETPKKKRLSVTLWKYTGRSIVKTIETYMSELKNDLDIVFKPVKKFTKKHLKGVDSSTLLVTENDQCERGTHTLQDKSKVTERNFGKEDEFVNWFAVDEKPSESKIEHKKVITLKKSDGTIVGLDAMEDVF